MALEKQKFQKLALASGLIGLILPVVGIVLAYYPGFIWLNNDLSDFGLYQPAFNWCLIFSGLFMAFFFLNLPPEMSAFINQLTRALFLLTCASLALLGFFPKNSPFGLHHNIAYVLFLLFPLVLILIARDFKKKLEPASNFTLIILIAFLIVWLTHYFLKKIYGYSGLALPEFFSLALALLWIYVLVFKYFRPRHF